MGGFDIQIEGFSNGTKNQAQMGGMTVDLDNRPDSLKLMHVDLRPGSF